MKPIMTAAEARQYLTANTGSDCRACGGTGTEYVTHGQYLFDADCIECGGLGVDLDGHTDGWSLPAWLDHDDLPDYMQDGDR